MASRSTFSDNAYTFLLDLAGDSGLDPGVIAAWMLAEEPVGGPDNPGTHNQNWLNIGYFDTGPGAITFSGVFATPGSAATATTKFLKGQWGGASGGIRAILSTAHQSPQAQIAAIQRSGWASSGYPDLPGLYASLDPAFKGQLGAAVPKGGVAGLGGSGTTPNSATKSGFAIGSTDNPDEDIWTGVNRLAQEVQWYLFSDGETVYYADGADLIAQDPGSNATVDRVKDSARIAAFEATLDNTAYQYQSHHKRKGKVQHKTQLAKIQSPTQVRLDLICGIDEFRAGDLIVLAAYGALNGRWLISDVTRSVFDVKSQLTLVPPVAPLTEVEAAGTSGTAGAASGSSGGRGGSSAGALSGSARDKVVQVARRAIARQASSRAYQYQEVRPYPRSLFGPAPIVTDCSGFSILCYKDAGQSDPNGTGFDGSGFTGSLLGRGTTVSHPQPADLCFYYGGSHVAVYLGNGRIANMGSPGEPVEESISAPGGYPYTCRSYL